MWFITISGGATLGSALDIAKQAEDGSGILGNSTYTIYTNFIFRQYIQIDYINSNVA